MLRLRLLVGPKTKHCYDYYIRPKYLLVQWIDLCCDLTFFFLFCLPLPNKIRRRRRHDASSSSPLAHQPSSQSADYLHSLSNNTAESFSDFKSWIQIPRAILYSPTSYPDSLPSAQDSLLRLLMLILSNPLILPHPSFLDNPLTRCLIWTPSYWQPCLPPSMMSLRPDPC